MLRDPPIWAGSRLCSRRLEATNRIAQCARIVGIKVVRIVRAYLPEYRNIACQYGQSILHRLHQGQAESLALRRKDQCRRVPVRVVELRVGSGREPDKPPAELRVRMDALCEIFRPPPEPADDEEAHRSAGRP